MVKNLKNRMIGFSLIELMIVISIIAILSAISIPSFKSYLAKAKRTEAFLNLNSIYMAEKIYWAENGEYSTKLYGENSIGWKPENNNFNYSYGFAQGNENEHYFIGKLKASKNSLKKSKVEKDKFIVTAAADIDGDGKLDIISIDQDNNIKIIQDDLID